MRPHSTEWYQRLSTLQQGYYYPWQSNLAEGNGEAAYRDLVHAQLGPTIDLLDVACGHGSQTLEFARHCRTVFAYDIIPSYIAMAQAAAYAQGITNATFVCYDSSIPANQGRATIPAHDDSFDLLVCNKGPFHWVEDARRVARSGATLLMLIPDGLPYPSWHDLLPDPLQWSFGGDPTWARTAMEPRLARSGITLHSWWSYDVPEFFTDPEQLYIRLTWGHAPDEKPPYAEVAADLIGIFAAYATPQGLALRHRRCLWKAIVTK